MDEIDRRDLHQRCRAGILAALVHPLGEAQDQIQQNGVAVDARPHETAIHPQGTAIAQQQRSEWHAGVALIEVTGCGRRHAQRAATARKGVANRVHVRQVMRAFCREERVRVAACLLCRLRLFRIALRLNAPERVALQGRKSGRYLEAEAFDRRPGSALLACIAVRHEHRLVIGTAFP